MLGSSEGTFCSLSKLWCKSPQTEFFGPERERFLYKVELLSRHVEENEQARTGRYVPHWTITDQDTLENYPALHRSSTDQAAA